MSTQEILKQFDQEIRDKGKMIKTFGKENLPTIQTLRAKIYPLAFRY